MLVKAIKLKSKAAEFVRHAPIAFSTPISMYLTMKTPEIN
jgi:hypothetical protein